MALQSVVLYLVLLFFPNESPVKVAELTSSVSKELGRSEAIQEDLEESKRVVRREELLPKIILAVRSLEFKGLRLSDEKRKKIAEAAYDVGLKYRIDPYFLVALARMESDFTAKPSFSPTCFMAERTACQADCGITQHALWGGKRYVLGQCKRLSRDHHYAMSKSAAELNKHIAWCKARQGSKWHRPFLRCVLNRYNSGHSYLTEARCTKRKRYCTSTCPKFSWVKDFIDEEDKHYRYKEYASCFSKCSAFQRRCKSRARYWKRLLCFYYGARTQKTLVRSCRYAHSLKNIPWYYRQTARYSIPVSLSF